jgi:hypothetical protein
MADLRRILMKLGNTKRLLKESIFIQPKDYRKIDDMLDDLGSFIIEANRKN